VQAMVQKAVEHYGRIDILMNMGGGGGGRYEDFREINPSLALKGHMLAGMLTTKHAARVMIEKQIRGAMVHIISDAGHQGESGNGIYSANKAGLMNFCRAAAMDLAQFGIRVNTISPTYIEHNLWRGLYQPGQPRTRLRVTSDDFLRGIPLGRFCRASDVGNTAVFLASEEASFLTAVDIPLDGGAMRKYWPWRPGDYTGITVEEYAMTIKRTRFGEPTDEPAIASR